MSEMHKLYKEARHQEKIDKASNQLNEIFCLIKNERTRQLNEKGWTAEQECSDRIAQLVKAAAIIVTEIEWLKRQEGAG